MKHSKGDNDLSGRRKSFVQQTNPTIKHSQSVLPGKVGGSSSLIVQSTAAARNFFFFLMLILFLPPGDTELLMGSGLHVEFPKIHHLKARSSPTATCFASVWGPFGVI